MGGGGGKGYAALKSTVLLFEKASMKLRLIFVFLVSNGNGDTALQVSKENSYFMTWSVCMNKWHIRSMQVV